MTTKAKAHKARNVSMPAQVDAQVDAQDAQVDAQEAQVDVQVVLPDLSAMSNDALIALLLGRGLGQTLIQKEKELEEREREDKIQGIKDRLIPIMNEIKGMGLVFQYAKWIESDRVVENGDFDNVIEIPSHWEIKIGDTVSIQYIPEGNKRIVDGTIIKWNDNGVTCLKNGAPNKGFLGYVAKKFGISEHETSKCIAKDGIHSRRAEIQGYLKSIETKEYRESLKHKNQ